MTYIPYWTKRKRTLSWYLSTIIPLLHWHSNLLWLTLWACAHFQRQSVVISPKIIPKHRHALFNLWREKWVTWVTRSLAIRLSKGRGQSSCKHLQLSGSSERPKAKDTNAQHSTEEISAFHQKEGSSWMACDKSCFWVISDFQELVAVVQTDCMHSLFTSHFLLLISNKKSNFQDFDSKKKLFFFFFCKARFICSKWGCRREKHSILWL